MLHQVYTTKQSNLTYQSLVLERVVDTPHEKPKRPEILKAELQYEVCHQHQGPDQQKFQVQKRAGRKGNTYSVLVTQNTHMRFLQTIFPEYAIDVKTSTVFTPALFLGKVFIIVSVFIL